MIDTHKRPQSIHCVTTDGTLIIITHKEDINIPITRSRSRDATCLVFLIVRKQRTLIINEIIEIRSRKIPADRENLHSLVVAFRANVELAIEYTQSTAIDTLNTEQKKKNFCFQ